MFDCSTVLIRGQKVPVMGQISMNSLIADVSDLSKVAVGDEVVIFGSQGPAQIDVDTIEHQSGTITADLFADWGQRNPRHA